MNISSSTALVTGANRGIGRALVAELLARGAAKVYAAARDPSSLTETLALDPARVVPLTLDITDRAAVAAAAKTAADVTLIINNAGLLEFGGALETEEGSFERQFAVNFYGPLAVARAFGPVVEANGGGALVNLLTVVSLAAMPGLAAYSASKAALWSLTQALRGQLAARGVAVHSVFPGPVDTEMAAAITLPKTSAADVARAIAEGIAVGREDILPDPMSAEVHAAWARNHKAVERQFAAA